MWAGAARSVTVSMPAFVATTVRLSQVPAIPADGGRTLGNAAGAVCQDRRSSENGPAPSVLCTLPHHEDTRFFGRLELLGPFKVARCAAQDQGVTLQLVDAPRGRRLIDLECQVDRFWRLRRVDLERRLALTPFESRDSPLVPLDRELILVHDIVGRLLPSRLHRDHCPLALELFQFLLGVLRRRSCCDQEHYGKWENDTNKHEKPPLIRF